MKNKFRYYMMLLIVCIIFSCNSSEQNPVDNKVERFNELGKVKWLLGEWQNNTAEGNATEIWEKKNDSTLAGKSYFVVGKDTVSSENISLEQRGSQLFYIPTIKEQNNGQPVMFTLTSSSDSSLVFENPQHDFPTKITYTKITNDSLLAEISGMTDGKLNSQKFPMKRVN